MMRRLRAWTGRRPAPAVVLMPLRTIPDWSAHREWLKTELARRLLEQRPDLAAAHTAAVLIVDQTTAEAVERYRKARLVRELHRLTVAVQPRGRTCTSCGDPMHTGIAHYCRKEST